MKLTVEQLKEKGFVELPSGNWAKGGIGDNLEIIKAETVAKPPKRIRQSSKPLLNQTEERWATIMEKDRGIVGIVKQGITLRLDPPFKSYRPDLAYFHCSHQLTFVEVKGPHRFAEKGIAKAALAAKTYPQFRFELVQWTGREWKESVLTP